MHPARAPAPHQRSSRLGCARLGRPGPLCNEGQLACANLRRRQGARAGMGVRTALLLAVVAAGTPLIAPDGAQQPPQHPSRSGGAAEARQPQQHEQWPGDGGTRVLVGRRPTPANTSYVLPCVHVEEDFGRGRPLLAAGHREQPLIPNQRTENFGHCWAPRCFRAAFDAFASDDECDSVLAQFRPMLEADATKKADGRDGYIGYSLRPSGENPVLLTVIERMAALLAEQFGAQGATPASVNVRSLDATDTPPHGDVAGSPERVFEEEWEAGGVTHQSIAAWHWDNTKKVDWLYTCLLYIGQGVEGGPTVFADSLGAGGRLSSGMLVGAVRGRLLCFSSGPENVHAGLPNTAGFRSLLQVWFKCAGSSEAPLSAAEAGRLRREELLRGREHWQWQQQQRRRQWEQQQRRPEL